MSRRWWISAGVGLIDDDGHGTVPWQALRAEPGGEGAEAWIELPTTRWGGRHRDLAARANFDHLETVYPWVQRVRAVEEGWRSLIVRDVDTWRLEEVAAALEAGYSISAASETVLMRRLLRERVEDMDLAGELPELVEESGNAGVARAIEAGLDTEAVVRAYLTVAADTAPLPAVDALGADFPAHEVVMERLVQAVRERPELVMGGVPLGGAPSWHMYERWLLG